jgi:hypothetical protein
MYIICMNVCVYYIEICVCVRVQCVCFTLSYAVAWIYTRKSNRCRHSSRLTVLVVRQLRHVPLPVLQPRAGEKTDTLELIELP